eukprot:CAMPEP_0194304600 /NCGR_PEP_ID=MMETSP0171-20130528/2311_1 /TAXON_ID=218684 /ORGANISM="Corethron pennatum, Strain L29A3" /LENGTH=313 /DNA_ID=CAMNT_0039055935 /DNA_START=96 /DNA_END=1038 /DNA_ORIENTATION=+
MMIFLFSRPILLSLFCAQITAQVENDENNQRLRRLRKKKIENYNLFSNNDQLNLENINHDIRRRAENEFFGSNEKLVLKLAGGFSFPEKANANLNSCGITDIERTQQMKEIINKLSPVSPKNQDNKAQRKALNWILDTDKKFLCPASPSLIQRFAAVTFYFATDGNNWRKIKTFLTSDSECEWSGLVCNIKGVIFKISLDSNNLGGYIPEEIALLKGLRVINMDDNNIGGVIPKGIGTLIELKELDLDSNEILGTIPNEIFNLINLTILDLNGNNFVGKISQKIKNLKKLEFFQIDNNDFTGTLPNALGVYQI